MFECVFICTVNLCGLQIVIAFYVSVCIGFSYALLNRIKSCGCNIYFVDAEGDAFPEIIGQNTCSAEASPRCVPWCGGSMRSCL